MNGEQDSEGSSHEGAVTIIVVSKTLSHFHLFVDISILETPNCGDLSVIISHMETTTNHLSMQQLESGLDHIRQSPKDEGLLHLIVRRPQVDARELLEEAELNPIVGLVGDTWNMRSSKRTPDGSPHPGMQINIMNARAAALVAQQKERWQLAGDQLFLDMDLSKENLPAGSQISIGSAILEVTPMPHTGCQKFVARFGLDAMTFVNSEVGKELCLRGINAKVVQEGTIRVGDTAKKL